MILPLVFSQILHMSKRKNDGSLFAKCQGIKGLADAHLRTVIARLTDRDDAKLYTKSKFCQRYSDILHCMQCSNLPTGTGTEAVTVWITDIAEFCQMRCAKDKVFFDSLKDYDGPCAEGLLYTDEITPGNPLRPDNARKCLLQPGANVWVVYLI